VWHSGSTALARHSSSLRTNSINSTNSVHILALHSIQSSAHASKHCKGTHTTVCAFRKDFQPASVALVVAEETWDPPLIRPDCGTTPKPLAAYIHRTTHTRTFPPAQHHTHSMLACTHQRSITLTVCMPHSTMPTRLATAVPSALPVQPLNNTAPELNCRPIIDTEKYDGALRLASQVELLQG
jgi:hypothetical protein